MNYGALWPGFWASYRRSTAVRWAVFCAALVVVFLVLLWLLNLPVHSSPPAPAAPPGTGA